MKEFRDKSVFIDWGDGVVMEEFWWGSHSFQRKQMGDQSSPGDCQINTIEGGS